MLNFKVVKVWVFSIRHSAPFPAKELGHDVRAVCSKETEWISQL